MCVCKWERERDDLHQLFTPSRAIGRDGNRRGIRMTCISNTLSAGALLDESRKWQTSSLSTSSSLPWTTGTTRLGWSTVSSTSHRCSCPTRLLHVPLVHLRSCHMKWQLAKASIFLRRHIHSDLKMEYLEVRDSLGWRFKSVLANKRQWFFLRLDVTGVSSVSSTLSRWRHIALRFIVLSANSVSLGKKS